MQGEFAGVSALVIKGIAQTEVEESKVEELKRRHCKVRGLEGSKVEKNEEKICQRTRERHREH